MNAKKKKFSITLMDSDEQRVRLAAALGGRGSAGRTFVWWIWRGWDCDEQKQDFPIALTPMDEHRIRVAAALEGCSFGRMIVLLVREGLDRRGVKGLEKEASA